MKLRLHYYSDCEFFAGCENMLANFFMSDELATIADTCFTYRGSDQYERGFKQRVGKPVKCYPLRVIEPDSFVLKRKYNVTRMMSKLLTHLLLVRYWCLLWNTVIIWRHLGRSGPIDILHVNNGGFPGARSCMAAVFAARLRGVRRIVYVVNNMAVGYRPGRWLDYPFDCLLVACVDRFVTASLSAGRQLTKVLALSPSRVVSIHNGVGLRAVTESAGDVLSRLSLPKGRPIFGVVAIMEERKGHIYLL
ncbi:MAG: glycosyltransferase, partial [Mariprofundaceae bacterium]|nr:glycosyltransferase [Mariprofundaceae bacterium]